MDYQMKLRSHGRSMPITSVSRMKMMILMTLCIATLFSNFPAESANTVGQYLTVCEGMTFAITCVATGPITTSTEVQEIQDPQFALLLPNGTIVESFHSETVNPNYSVASTKINKYNSKTVYLVGKASFTRDNQMRYGCFNPGEWNPLLINAVTLMNVIPKDACTQLPVMEPTTELPTSLGTLCPKITDEVTTPNEGLLTRMTSPRTLYSKITDDVTTQKTEDLKRSPGNAIARQENIKSRQTGFAILSVLVAGLVIVVIVLLLYISRIKKSTDTCSDSINLEQRGEPNPVEFSVSDGS